MYVIERDGELFSQTAKDGQDPRCGIGGVIWDGMCTTWAPTVYPTRKAALAELARNDLDGTVRKVGPTLYRMLVSNWQAATLDRIVRRLES